MSFAEVAPRQFVAGCGFKLIPVKALFRFKKELNHGLSCVDRLSLTMNGVLPRSIDDSEGLQTSDYSVYQIVEPADLLFKLIDLQNIKTSRVGLVPTRGIVSPAYIRLSSFEQSASSRYYYWFFYAMYGENIFNAMGAGVRQTLNQSDLLNIQVPKPPFDKQLAIASYLNVETARIDALIAEKKLLVNALAELKKSVVLEAITTGVRRNQNFAESGLSWVNKIPKHWKTASLKRCVRLVGGHTPSTTNLAYWDGAIPWFSPKDMKSDELEDSIDHVTDAAVFETGLSIIEPGTTMIVVRGMILAHTFPVCVTKVQGTLNQDMKALVPDETLDKLYLPWLLRGVASLFLSLTDQSGHGTMALRTDRFMSERLPIPPLDEQLEIVAHLEAERLRIDQLLAHVLTELDLFAELRSSTITDAVLGRIDVRTSVQNRKEIEAA